MKYLHDWKPGVNFDDFVDVGDYVNWEIIDHFYSRRIIVKYNGSYLQIGPGHGFIDGRDTFFTFSKDPFTGNWVYYGRCHLGEKYHRGYA